MIATTQCPSVDVLRRYAIGEYADEEGDSIEAHLSECASCEDMLARFDDTGDSLVRHLPLTGRQSRDDDSSGWLKRLMSGPRQTDRTPAGTEQDIANQKEYQGNFGAYDLCGVLGKGGMGVVYEARHRQLGRPVAIKVVSPKLIAASEAQRRFDREIQVLGALRHPGIVSATDAGRVGGAAYLVMERIDGIDLSTLVRRTGPLSVAETCEVGRQIALALAAAHDAQAIHRDVKPSNVMIDRDGNVKLLDFGLAHLADSIGSRHDTSLGRLLGTLDYMAPEQAEGKSVTPSVDLYGLGATLFFLLTGRPPKPGDREQTLLGQIRAVTEATAPRLSDIRNDVPAALSDLVAALLENDPEQRLSQAAEAATALEQFTNEHSPAALEQLVESAGISTPQTEGRDAVVRSLSELLGSESAEVFHSQASRNWFGRFRWIALGLAGLGAVIALGIILLIRTDKGTIRIESEVAGVTVEFLDEQERVEKFRLENKAGETQLKAGKYRVRLAGGYDSLTVEPDVIVLTKNETEVARVSVLTDEGSGSGAKSVSEGDDVPALYRGETEAVWQRRFQAETDPLAKIEAGRALISLSERLSTEDRVRRIVKIGGELVESGWGDNPDDYFSFEVQFVGRERLSAKRWSATKSQELYQAWKSFDRLAETTCESLELATVATTLAATIPNSSTSEAIFATSLLDELTGEIIREKPAACDTVLQIRLDEDSPLRLYLCIVQADYFPGTSVIVIMDFIKYCTDVGEAIIADDVAGESYTTAREWFQKCLDNDIPLTLPLSRNLKARVAQSMLFASPEQTMEDIFQTKWMDDGSLPYPDEWMKAAREARYAIWDAWLPHLNAWLESHPEENEQSRLMLSTLNVALRLYKHSDEWPIASLARQLTQRAEIHKPVDGAITRHDLLSYIILAGGELPPQSRKLLDADVSKLPHRVRELAELLGDENGWDINKLQKYEGVLLEHPVATVALLTRVVSGPEIHGVSPAGLKEKLVWLSGRGNGDDSPPPVEPLLLLAVLTELTGESEAQDERIAELFTEPHPQRIFARHILDAVVYPYALREVALKWLRRMRERAVSEKLIDEIDKLLPGEVRDRAEFLKNNPDSLLAVLHEYNKETRESRTMLFDPPIPDLTIEQLTSAFRSAADKYRKLGNNSIADALKETAESGRLAEGLNMWGVTGTIQRSKKDGELTFRQFVPQLSCETGPRSAKMVVLPDVELRYSRDGWSSPDWGVIHPPLTGVWELKSVTANGKELADEEFQRWKNQRPALSRISIENNDTIKFADESTPFEFDLELDYASTPAKFRLVQSGEVKYSGFFTTNASIDFTKLSLTLDLDGGPPPERDDTEESDAVRLSYERVDTGDETETDEDAGETEGDES